MTTIESDLFETAGKCAKDRGVQPVFLSKEQAIDYAQTRACFRSGEIRVFDLKGVIEGTIPFSEADRKL